MKLTFIEKIVYLLGYRYVYNKRSDEVHRLSHKHKNCGIQFMSRCNKRYLTEGMMEQKMMDGADGCRWCWNERNSG